MNEMKRMLSFVRRAVDDYSMIADGDRIAVGVKGNIRSCMSFTDTLTLKVTISPDIINPFLKSVLITSEKTFNSFVKLWVSISLTKREKIDI